jgi:two-component system, chemotaxis family, sensor kinase CheA
MDELLFHFIAEGRELTQRATEDLLALEQAPHDAARLDSAFRAIHTLKGSVGLFDFLPLATALHAAEDLLGALRDGMLAADRGTLDVLLDCVGTAEAWIEAISGTGVLPPDAQAVSNGLVAAMAVLLGEPHAAPASPEPASGAEWVSALLARHATAVADAAAAGETLIALRYTPDAGCFMRGEDPLALVRRIPELRAVWLTPRAPWPAGPGDPLVCNLVIEVLSAAPAADIAKPMRFVSDQIAIARASGAEPAAAAQMQGEPPRPDTTARTLRIDAGRVDALGDIAAELIVAQNGLAHLAAEAATAAPVFARALSARQANIERLVGALQRGVTQLRSVRMDHTFRRFPRLVREAAGRLGKQVQFDILGADTEADKTVVDALYEPLLHALRNAVDHGIETAAARATCGKAPAGRITLAARRDGGQIVATVTDDGTGIDPAQIRRIAVSRGIMPAAQADLLSDAATLELMFAPGFSTAGTVTDLSGRGVGLDAVRRAVQALGGDASIASTPGAGSTLRVAVPLMVTVTTILLVRAGQERFGVKLEAVAETVRVPRSRINSVHGGAAFVLRDRTIPLLCLASLLDIEPAARGAEAKILVTSVGAERVGLEVDGFGTRMDVVLRPMAGLLAGMKGIAGSALLGDGTVLLVLGLADLTSGA